MQRGQVCEDGREDGPRHQQPVLGASPALQALAKARAWRPAASSLPWDAGQRLRRRQVQSATARESRPTRARPAALPPPEGRCGWHRLAGPPPALLPLQTRFVSTEVLSGLDAAQRQGRGLLQGNAPTDAPRHPVFWTSASTERDT